MVRAPKGAPTTSTTTRAACGREFNLSQTTAEPQQPQTPEVLPFQTALAPSMPGWTG